MPPPVRFGPYEIVAPIGAGGMGEVYRARDTRLGREVAVKVLPAALASDPERLRRFETEARATAALSHPNVLAVFDLGTHEGSPYLVEELLEGETLRERLSAGPLPPRKAVELALQVAHGLAAAHDRGIVHRDLKPENLFITRDGIVKILDFGLARLVAPETDGTLHEAPTEMECTELGAVLGTMGYMAPEQLRGQHVDHRADIFAFGCVFYEMLSGRPAFRHDTRADTISALLHADPPPLADSGRDIPSGLDRIVHHCVEKRPEDRFSSARDLALALSALSEAGDLRPGVESAIARPRLHGRRVAGLATGAIVLLVAVALAVWLSKGRTAAAEPIRSIAVLPLANLSGDASQEYFVDGLTEELIADLSKIKALKVISRTSVMQYKGVQKPLPEIAKQLGVGGIIEGSVLKAGHQVRITVQLVNASTDTNLWAKSYDRDLRDVLTLQEDVSKAIAREVSATVTPAEQVRLSSAGPIDPEAHELYLMGRFHWWKRTGPDLARAIDEFRQAIARDPNYAAAYAGLADAYVMSADNGFQPPAVGRDQARAAALKAVALNDSLAEAHVALGNVYDNYDWDWARGEAEFRRAIELDPNSALGYFFYGGHLSTVGRNDEAVAAGLHARELDPLGTRINAVLAAIFYCARRYNEATAAGRRTLELDPNDEMGHLILGETYLREDMHAQAVAELERLRGRDGAAALVGAYAAAGRMADARRQLAAIMDESRRRYVHAYVLAVAHVGVAGEDEIFAWLDKAYQERDLDLPWGTADPMWDRVRSDPRFVDLLRRMHL